MKAFKVVLGAFLIIICGWSGLRLLLADRRNLPTAKDYENIAEGGLPIVQAISDYRNDHGLLPEQWEDLVPNYMAKLDKDDWFWIEWGILGHYGPPGTDRNFVIYSFVGDSFLGLSANQWSFSGETATEHLHWQVPGPTNNRPPLTGKALFEAKLKEYEQRINRHPGEQDYYRDKICFLALEKHKDMLRQECERAEWLFPRWWLPQMALAELDMSNTLAKRKFAAWVQEHETFVNYWYLARYYRDKGNVVEACLALEHAAVSEFEPYPVDAGWVGAGFAYDAAKFSYENRKYGLTIKLCRHCEPAQGSGGESLLALQAAAEFGLRQPHDTNYIYHTGEAAGFKWTLFAEPRP